MRTFRHFAVFLSMGASIVSVQAQEYRLQPGDALQFTVLGANAVDQRITIDLDGRVRVPIGGSFEAAGRTVEQLRSEIVEKLKAGSFPIGTDGNGRTVWDAIFPEAIVLDVAEYRPIYVSGDVLSPGTQPFRSGTTVRQAIAVAGGASPFRTRQDPTLELLGAREQLGSLLAKQIGLEFQLVRVQAELAGRPDADFSQVPDNGLDAGQREELQRTEQETFTSRTEDLAQQLATIQEGIRTIETRRSLLAQVQKNLEEETSVYEAELKRIEGLYSKGLVQVTRLNDARRSVFLVSTRSLDTSAEVARLERELVELRSSLENAAAERRAQNLASLKAASLELTSTQADIERLRQRLAYYAPRESQPEIEIVRSDTGSPQTLPATLDTTLLPGDTLLVRLAAAEDAPAREASVPAPPADGGSVTGSVPSQPPADVSGSDEGVADVASTKPPAAARFGAPVATPSPAPRSTGAPAASR